MSGEIDLQQLLSGLTPLLQPGEFVFCTVPGGTLAESVAFEPLMSFVEAEGLTLILPRARAEAAGLAFEGAYRQLTLGVHSSLEAVGLSAAVCTALAAEGISANMVAAFYHDHVFVPVERAEQALDTLRALSGGAAG